jgi:hypothetical protein
MKVKTIIYWTHNPFEEIYRVSRMRENFTYGSYGEGLETDSSKYRASPLPDKSFIGKQNKSWDWKKCLLGLVQD